jgi:sulfatase maturation enzyme AslB (radical SAM superfamily)
MKEEQLNYFCQKAYRASRKKLLELRAVSTRKRFSCEALSGKSDYNICINSDMTVSCNCQDYDGTGQIGDLNCASIEEVFASPTARYFRRSLASGRLPILTCASCSELKYVSPDEARHYAGHWQVCSKGIMLENTVACPYQCVACYRSKVLGIRRATHMSLDNTWKVAEIIRSHGIKRLSLFNLGETFAAPDIVDQLRIIRKRNPNLFIFISTNGSLLSTPKRREAAMLANHLVFSIDGIDDYTVNKYQRTASFSKMYRNMRKLVEHRNRKGDNKLKIEWKYVLFNWNDREKTIIQAIELARSAGVDSISFWPTKSPLYGISWRYYLKKFYKTIGESTWKGREVIIGDP